MRRLLLGVALAALAGPAEAASPASSPWAQKNANSQHTSSTTFTGPARPRSIWTKHFDNQGAADAAPSIGDDGSVYAVSYTSIAAVNTDGTLRWTYPLYSSNFGRQAAVSNDGRVFISSALLNGTNFVLGLNTSDGSVAVWGPEFCPAIGGSSPLYSVAGRLYYAYQDPSNSSSSSGGCLQAYNDNGSSAWTASPGTGLTDQGALSPDESVYYYNDDAKLYALNAATGVEAWNVSVVGSGISVGLDGTIYFSRSNQLAAYNTNGTPKWTLAADGLPSGPVAVQGNTVYLSTYTSLSFQKFHSVSAVNGSDGSVAWSVQVATSLTSHQPSTAIGPEIGPLTVAGDTLLFTMHSIRFGESFSDNIRVLVALDRSNGRQKWIAALPTNSGYAGQPVPTSTRLYHFDETDLTAMEESNAASFTVSASTSILAPGQSTTLSATVLTSTGGAISNVSVFFDLVSGTATPVAGRAFTNDLGVATLTFSTSSLNSSVVESTFVVRVQCLDFPNVNVPIFVEGEAIDHFALQVPTGVAVGVPFDMKAFARNRYNHALPSFPGTDGPAGVTLTPYLAGSSVAASGSLGTTVVGISNGTGTVTGQTYNKIEDISIKAAQTFPGTAFGFSSNFSVTGPSQFRVSVPTAATAGTPFSMSITALDQGGNLVRGYTGSLAISALISPATTQAGAGVLGQPTAVMSSLGVLTIANQTYSKGETLAIRVADASIGAVGTSTNALTVSVVPNPITHYTVTIATQVTVGLPFSMQVNGLNASSAAVSYSALDTNLNIAARLSGTSFSGSGSLGASAATLVAGSTFVIVSPQTYNKIETIQLRITDADGRVGLSGPVVVAGPTTFDISVPTYTVATGQAFRLTVVAKDNSGTQVTGYNGTANVLAVKAADTSQAGGGTLGITSLVFSGGVANTDFETYSKGESIRIKLVDPVLNVSSVSASFTVAAPVNNTSHYSVTAPTQVTVGLPFSMQINALDASSAAVSYAALNTNLSIAARLSGTTIAGGGSLGASAAVLVAGSTFVIVNPQSYNTTETIQLRITDPDGRVGLSGSIVVSGPTTFEVSVPTYTVAAGAAFRVTIVAKDAGGNQVLGYNGSVNLVAVKASDPSQAGTGTLGITSLSMSGGQGNTDYQTYSKGEVIRIKAVDAVLNVSSTSPSLTVSAPTDNTSHYSVTVPTFATVGLPFTIQVQSLDASSAPVTYSLAKNISVQARLNGTSVAGSGSLGIPTLSLAANASSVSTTLQTYSGIETIQVRVTDADGRGGLSGPVVVGGPATFSVSVPTFTVPSGQAFRLTVVARDGSGSQVLGYNGTVNLVPLKDSDPSLTASGTLGITSLVLSGGLGNTDFQTYSTGEVIRIKAVDPVLNVSSNSAALTVTVPASLISHYSITVPTQVTVGLPFSMQINALNTSSAAVSYATLPTNLSIAARLSGTSISGSGSLGASAATLVAGSTFVIVNPQSYNKTETIQLRVTDTNGRVGLSGAMVVSGPTTFEVSVPTYTVPAGANFRLTVVAKDSGGSQVTGYTGTVNLLAVKASDPSQSATGTLGVTALAMSGGQANTDFQTYSKGDSIRIKVVDPTLNVSSVSASFTVSAPADNTSHYSVTVPTQVTVGLTFPMSVQSLNASSAAVTYALPKNISLQVLLNGTQVAGSGSLGLPLATLQAGQSTVSQALQTYNKIETVQILATDENGKTGISGPVVFAGPASFVVTVPTTPVTAGTAFSLNIVAKDAGGSQVLGYNGSLALSAVVPSSPSVSAGGTLGIANVTLSSGSATVSQTYTKSGSVTIRALDTALSLSALSSAMTITAGPPAAVALGANPGSVILGQTSALTATVEDSFDNLVEGATVAFTVIAGSGTLARDQAGLLVNLVSTTAVTGSNGAAATVFGLPAGLTQAQRNVVHATVSSLQASATIYVSVLITRNGGVAVQSDDPRTLVTIPANAFPFDVSVNILSKSELPPGLAAKVAGAFGKATGQFVQDLAKQIQALKGNTTQDAGTAADFAELQLPFDTTGGSVTVQGLQTAMVRIQSVLVPASILRIYKLNEAEELWEQVSEGNVADVGSQVVKAKTKKVSGVYTLGAPPFTTVQAGQSGTVTTMLSGGATVQVDVPAGAFGSATAVSVDAVGSASLPTPAGGAVPLLATGIGLDVKASGLQPSKPLKLTISYTASQAAGFDEALFRVARYDGSRGLWILLDSQVDVTQRRVVGFTDHLSLFQVMQVQPQTTLTGAIAYPSPFRPTQGHTKITFGRLKAGSTVRLFSVGGRFLREMTADSTGVAQWDVKDSDGSAVASGVYLALIEAGGDKKTLKVAVQR